MIRNPEIMPSYGKVLLALMFSICPWLCTAQTELGWFETNPTLLLRGDWVDVVVDGEGYVFSVDQSSLKVKGQQVAYRVRYSGGRDKDLLQRTLGSGVNYYVSDCLTNTKALRYFAAYRLENAELLYRKSIQHPLFEAVSPNSVGAALHRFACERAGL